MRTIWLVTHARTQTGDEKTGFLTDPLMKPDAYEAVARLKLILNRLMEGKVVSQVQCGTGSRQWQVVCALGFQEREVYFSDLWGGPATIVKRQDGSKAILLCSGKLIPYDRFASLAHLGGEVIENVIRTLPDNTLICSGRPVLVRLGLMPEQCLSGAIYALSVEDDGIDISPLTEGERLLEST